MTRFRIVLSAASAVVATLADFCLVVVLVQRLKVQPFLATALGCTIGAVVNFVMNRRWTFRSSGPVRTEASRYAVVSATTMLFNSAGVRILQMVPWLDFRLSWWMVRAGVFLLWSYPRQCDFVFLGGEGDNLLPAVAVAPLDGN